MRPCVEGAPAKLELAFLMSRSWTWQARPAASTCRVKHSRARRYGRRAETISHLTHVVRSDQLEATNIVRLQQYEAVPVPMHVTFDVWSPQSCTIDTALAVDVTFDVVQRPKFLPWHVQRKCLLAAVA